ncbi:MAG TPA: protein kinase [Micromonosporaceae bacterium]|nr:protein kinase [Micromonosporaceae bacterium]
MLSAGTMLGGRYRLAERIAGGGMGDVWRGTDEVLGRTVAVKVLLPALMEEPGFVERFRGEARTMATVNHPGVVDIYDYGSESGTAFLVMEYVEGEALAETLSRVRRLTPARTMALVAQAAEALHAAHGKGIVHRDVKPGNLLVRPNGTLVLTDFGIARSAMVGQLTAVGSVLGTASYISPEQASGRTATALSDVYALGVVAYQCLAGRRPFDGDNAVDIAMRHINEPPAPLPPDTPPAVRQIVERALAKDPAARWPTAAALAQVARRASSQLAGGPAVGHAVARPPGTPVPTQPGGRPTSGAPRPTSGAPRPHSPGAPAGASTPGYARGSAGVPVGAYRAPQPPSAGGAAPVRPAAPGPAQPVRRRGGLTAAILVLCALLLLFLGGMAAVRAVLSGGGGADAGDSPASSQPGRNPDAVPIVKIPCDKLKGGSLSNAEATLERLGLDPEVETVDAGGQRNTVISVPCEAAEGSKVNISVRSGKARGGGKAGPTGGTKPGSPAPSGIRRSSTAPTSSAPSAPAGGASCAADTIGDLVDCVASTRP